MSILDKYVVEAPSTQTTFDIFKGEWTSKLPGDFAQYQTGAAASVFFEDRI